MGLLQGKASIGPWSKSLGKECRLLWIFFLFVVVIYGIGDACQDNEREVAPDNDPNFIGAVGSFLHFLFNIDLKEYIDEVHTMHLAFIKSFST